MWLYGSGFPKSMDISKSLDKRNGRNNKDFKELGNYLKEKRGSKSQKEISKYFPSKSGGLTGCVSNWEKGMNVPTLEQYKILKEKLDLDDTFDWLIEREEAEREIIGQKKSNAVDVHKWLGEMYEKHESNLVDITIPSTALAKQWQGWGTCLKPSFEPIIVARKPFKGSLVDNVIEYGVGGINIDECRVRNQHFEIKNGEYDKPTNNAFGHIKRTPKEYDGRFPANTILTYDETDFDEVCGGFPYTKSTGGSTSRYFYTAKASKRDRDEGLETFNQEKVNDGRNTPIDNAFQRGETLRRNVHPCVKPTTLMQYLVRLVTPNNGTILDPFNGSGSTGKAVMYESKDRNKNYKYIGIELSEEYLEISKARINFALEQIEVQKKEEEDQISLWQE